MRSEEDVLACHTGQGGREQGEELLDSKIPTQVPGNKKVLLMEREPEPERDESRCARGAHLGDSLTRSWKDAALRVHSHTGGVWGRAALSLMSSAHSDHGTWARTAPPGDVGPRALARGPSSGEAPGGQAWGPRRAERLPPHGTEPHSPRASRARTGKRFQKSVVSKTASPAVAFTPLIPCGGAGADFHF